MFDDQLNLELVVLTLFVRHKFYKFVMHFYIYFG